VKEIQRTQQFGTEDDLNSLLDAVRQLSELHPKQIEHLLKIADSVRVAIRERGGKKSPLTLLASRTRSTSGGYRLIGPETIPAEGTFSLVIIPDGEGGEKPATLHLKASPGVTLPNQVEWKGRPLVIPVSIKSKPGSIIAVAGGPTPSANAMSYDVLVERSTTKVGN
jgi:hypothetical protein